MDIRKRYDVVIVGARCAGAATGMLLARQGLDVLIVDEGRYGSDTLSTHALMRPGVWLLHHWNILDKLLAAGTPLIRQTSFHYGDEEAKIEIRPRHGIEGLVAPRRTLLDAALADAAREAGATLRYETRATAVTRKHGRVDGVTLRSRSGSSVHVEADWIVGADGIRSRIARLVDAAPYRRSQHATALIYAHWDGLATTGYHWHYRPAASAGVIPTGAGHTCVFAAMPPSHFAAHVRTDTATLYHDVIQRAAPEVAEALRHAQRVEAYHAFPGQPGHLRPAHGTGWALVGDAGYFRDPLTAHGMTDALRDASMLARAIVDGSAAAMDAYWQLRDRLALPFFEATDAIASFAWDFETLQRHHLAMSRAMNLELDTLLALEATPHPLPADVAALVARG